MNRIDAYIRTKQANENEPNRTQIMNKFEWNENKNGQLSNMNLN